MLVRVYQASIHKAGTKPVFRLVQEIPSQDVRSVRCYTDDAVTYLVVANFVNPAGSNYSQWSVVYRLSDLFLPIQFIPTVGAFHAEVFAVDASRFLAISQYYDLETARAGTSGFGLASRVFKWNIVLSEFEETASVATLGASMFKHFRFHNSEFLFLTERGAAAHIEANSTLYVFNGSTSALTPVERVPTRTALGSDFFEADDTGYLVVANYRLETDLNQFLSVYTLNTDPAPQLTLHQTVPCVGCLYPEVFQANERTFLAVAGRYTGSTFANVSPLYVFNAQTRLFEHLENMQTDGIWSLKHFALGSLPFHFCVAAEGHLTGLSSVYYVNHFCVQDD